MRPRMYQAAKLIMIDGGNHELTGSNQIINIYQLDNIITPKNMKMVLKADCPGKPWLNVLFLV